MDRGEQGLAIGGATRRATAGATPAAAAPHAPAPDSAAPFSGPGESQAEQSEIPSLTFDAALAQLGEVVGRLEAGGLPLETSIALYERGVALHAHCARLLDDAELRVQRLVEDAGGLRAIDLAPDDADDDGTASA